MRKCLLTGFEDYGKPVVTAHIDLPASPDLTTLDRLHRAHLQGVVCRYALIELDGRIRALFLNEKHIPRGTVRTAPRRRAPGRWVTTALRLGEFGGGRAVAGPELFFRQVDLGGRDAWLATVLMRVSQAIKVRELSFEDGKLFAWNLADQQFYYQTDGARWRLLGAGNTAKERIEEVVAVARPSTMGEFLWSVGAIRLSSARRLPPRTG